MPETLGQTFASRLAQKDAAALSALLAPDVDFKGLTPSRLWEAGTPDDVLDVVLGNWFEPTDRIDEVTSVDVGQDVGDTHHVSYRFTLSNDNGPQVVEQQVYYRDDGVRLTYLRIICSGFRPRAE